MGWGEKVKWINAQDVVVMSWSIILNLKQMFAVLADLLNTKNMSITSREKIAQKTYVILLLEDNQTMYECDYCVRGNWYCQNKCPLRPPNYSPKKQQDILEEAIDHAKATVGGKPNK